MEGRSKTKEGKRETELCGGWGSPAEQWRVGEEGPMRSWGCPYLWRVLVTPGAKPSRDASVFISLASWQHNAVLLLFVWSLLTLHHVCVSQRSAQCLPFFLLHHLSLEELVYCHVFNDHPYTNDLIHIFPAHIPPPNIHP